MWPASRYCDMCQEELNENRNIFLKLALTSAISVTVPNRIDVKCTNKLRNTLMTYRVFESDDEMHHRTEVFDQLWHLVRQWIWQESLRQNMPPSIADTVGGNIHSFGTYQLGKLHLGFFRDTKKSCKYNTKTRQRSAPERLEKDLTKLVSERDVLTESLVNRGGADIDILCVAPQHIHRNDFFESFYKLLEQHSQVKYLRAVEHASVPVIKVNFDGVAIDLYFARLALREIPDWLDLRNDRFLRNLDEKCVRSLNRYRVSDEILSLVPDIGNFRLTLTAIQLWAKRRGIYSHTLGFLGGGSWALLVARTCQLYPNALPSTLVNKFFLVFSQWKWPRPVVLKQSDNIDLGFLVWDPRVNISHRLHLMPIITPVYPQKNTSFNVSPSTRTIITEELRRGLAITEKIMLGQSSWDWLFEAPKFFSRYDHFIVLNASSATTYDQLEWCNLIEYNICDLIMTFESNQHIKIAHVNPECYNSVPLNTNNGQPLALPPGTPILSKNMPPRVQKNYKGEVISNYCSMWFIGLVLEKTTDKLDLAYDISLFTKAMLYQAQDSDMDTDELTIRGRQVRREQVYQYLSPSLLKREGITSCVRQAKPEPPQASNSMMLHFGLPQWTPIGEQQPNVIRRWKDVPREIIPQFHNAAQTEEVNTLSYNKYSNSSE